MDYARFKQKYSASSNSFCKVFISIFAGRLFGTLISS